MVVHDLIFDVYGNGHFIPAGSNGIRVLRFWTEQGGMYLAPAIVAFCACFARATSLLAAAAVAMLAALSTWLKWITGFVLVVLVGGASLG